MTVLWHVLVVLVAALGLGLLVGLVFASVLWNASQRGKP